MRRYQYLFVTFLAVFFLKATAQDFSSEQRVALIIGNASYDVGPLNNPVNDARSMDVALRDAGFEVMLYENVRDAAAMKRAVREFGIKIQDGGVGLFYYSGHGIQVDGRNFLVPTKATISHEGEVEYECLDVGFVMAQMENARNRMNILVLDACRNNPFSRSFRSSTNGLASINAPTGTLIAYATAPGSVASDGYGSNGLYTEQLLVQIRNHGQKIEDVFKNARANVLKSSNNAQTPWESSSLVGDFYFYPPVVDNTPPATTTTTTSTYNPSSTYTSNSSNTNISGNTSGTTSTSSTSNASTTNTYTSSSTSLFPGMENTSSTTTSLSSTTTPLNNTSTTSSLSGGATTSSLSGGSTTNSLSSTTSSISSGNSKIKRATGVEWKSEDLYYNLYINDESVASETTNSKSNNDLVVYHKRTNRTFILEDFYDRQDNVLRTAMEIEAPSATIWRSKDLYYSLYYKGKNIATSTENSNAYDHLIAYYATEDITFVLKDFYDYQDDELRGGDILYSGDNVFWASDGSSYKIFLDGKNIGKDLKDSYFGSSLQVYDPITDKIYLLKNYKYQKDGDVHPGELVYTPGMVTWSRKDNSYSVYKDGRFSSNPTNNSWSNDDLLVYDQETGLTFLFENYDKRGDGKQRPAKLLYSEDQAFFRRKDNTFALYIKGEFIEEKMDAEWQGDDLKVYLTVTGDTYLFEDYEYAGDNKLRPARKQ